MRTKFAGEDFLQVELPDYETELSRLSALLVFSALFWILVAPLFCAVERAIEQKSAAANDKNGSGGSTSSSNNGTTTPRRSKKSTIKRGIDATEQKKYVQKNRTEKVIPAWATFCCVVGLLLSSSYFLLTMSPHNYYTARRVFQAPLLDEEECRNIIAMAESAANRNYQESVKKEGSSDNSTQKHSLLEEPFGWQKSRHGSYPTTDLNLVTDPFTAMARKFVGDLMDRRLAPLLSRIYGIPKSSIRANDMFVVRYDATSRAFLAYHTDDSHISFNVLLNNEFEGGGTRFWNRAAGEPFAHVQPSIPGTVLTHSALIHHEGATITAGTRLILVGFLSIDKADPLTGKSTGLSSFASWLSLPWLHRYLKDSYEISHNRLNRNHRAAENLPIDMQARSTNKWTDGIYIRMLFLDLIKILQATGDMFASHQVEDLVHVDQRSAYLQALDDAHDPTSKGASWWKGQQIRIGIDGEIESERKTRTANAEAFQEL